MAKHKLGIQWVLICADIAKGLELGADDYVAKPFSHIELLARVQAVMRHSRCEPAAAEEQPYTSGKLRIDFARNEVTVNGGYC